MFFSKKKAFCIGVSTGDGISTRVLRSILILRPLLSEVDHFSCSSKQYEVSFLWNFSFRATGTEEMTAFTKKINICRCTDAEIRVFLAPFHLVIAIRIRAFMLTLEPAFCPSVFALYRGDIFLIYHLGCHVTHDIVK